MGIINKRGSMITKAIIPVAGWGTRRLPITKVVEKSMLPVGNRPLVDYSVQELIKAGVKDIYMVVSNVEPCQVRAFYRDNLALNQYLVERGKEDKLEKAKTLPDDVKIHYVAQDPSGKYGTAVPIALAVEEFKIDEPVLVFMGDDFIWNPGGESAAEALIKVAADGESAILGVEIDKNDVEKYGVLSAKDGKLVGVVEKPTPEEAPSNLINVSKYIMTPDLLKRIVDYVAEHDFGPKDQEYVVTDPIDAYIKDGGVMRVASTGGEYLDGGSVEGWLHANTVVCR
ncbi:NTP transferase domain-containing protein [Candidatus Saccharibacteria bacterium]|nr:NTP transferase domain-containing protein [Candidatus Saccharibacteria bacterium]